MTRGHIAIAFVALLAGAALLVVYADRRQSARIDRLERGSASLLAANEQSERKVEALRTRIDLARREAATRGKRVAALQRRVRSLTKNLSAARSQLASTRVRLDEVRTQAARAQAQAAQARAASDDNTAVTTIPDALIPDELRGLRSRDSFTAGFCNGLGDSWVNYPSCVKYYLTHPR